jgi:LysM repeat protein
MHPGLTRSLVAIAAAGALLGIAACADPDDSSDSSGTTVVTITQADVQTIPPTSSTAPPQPGDVVQTELDYEVQSGDFLSGIASRYSVSLDDMVAYNEWPDGANHPLYPGDIIKIPPGYKLPTESTTTTAAASETSGATDSTAAPSSTIDTSEGGSYEVQAGDYLAGIAIKVGSTIDAIVAANGWADGANHPLYPGDIIKIP